MWARGKAVGGVEARCQNIREKFPRLGNFWCDVGSGFLESTGGCCRDVGI